MGVRGERTEHTKTFRRTLAGFGLTWHRKVHFLTFSGKLTFQCTRNGLQNPPFCPGSIQDTFIFFLDISPPDLPKIFRKETNVENRKFGSLTTQVKVLSFAVPGQ